MYREENGQVILAMSREDYERVLMVFGMAAGAALQGRAPLALRIISPLLNRINEGNPAYERYREEGPPKKNPSGATS